MTHVEGVEIAARWLKNKQKCVVVATEVVVTEEIPDAIGFTYRGRCHVVEVKVSLSDFKADSKKFHREFSHGCGCFRWYLAPKGVIPIDLIPDNWGFLEVSNGRVSIVRDLAPVGRLKTDQRREKMILVRLMRGMADPAYVLRHRLFVEHLVVP